MDMAEDSEGEEVEVGGDLASEEALLPGLMLVWEGEDCRDVAISSAELRGCPSHRVTPPMADPGARPTMKKWPIRELCRMGMPGYLWEQIRMVRR
jgi:hypothetical protein